MNELKTLESRLRSWKPRGPSPRIGRRLFGDPPAAESRDPLAVWRWLAPAMCCLAMTLFMAGGYDPAANREAEISAAALPGGRAPAPAWSNAVPQWEVPPVNTEANRLDRAASGATPAQRR